MIEPVIIGRARLYLGNALEIVPTLGRVAHFIFDPPYESRLHDSKNSARGVVRIDGGADLSRLDFAPIDEIRPAVVAFGEQCDGWFIAFCTVEGVAKWADEINASPMKYKRACIWVKPDSTPQLNGQCPAQGAEIFVAAWAGSGHWRWAAGGKRGVYTHCVNNNERHGFHPTEKPRRLMSEIVGDFTYPGETICDPFMGSGTTGVAATMARRDFIGIEKDERYFDIAAKRIEDAQRQGSLFNEGAAAA